MCLPPLQLHREEDEGGDRSREFTTFAFPGQSLSWYGKATIFCAWVILLWKVREREPLNGILSMTDWKEEEGLKPKGKRRRKKEGLKRGPNTSS